MSIGKRIPFELIVAAFLLATLGLVLWACKWHVTALATSRTNELHARMAGCSRLRIDCPPFSEEPNATTILFETQDANEIDSFAHSISLAVHQSRQSCTCKGSLMFRFYTADEPAIAFSLIHGKRIRLPDNSEQGELDLSVLSKQDLKAWLQGKGIEPKNYGL